MDEIKQFRVIQEKRNKLTIQLVIAENKIIDNQILQKAKHKIQNLFGENMQVEFQFLEKIKKDSDGKLRKIISRIPVHIK